jgi:hypothetical protein
MAYARPMTVPSIGPIISIANDQHDVSAEGPAGTLLEDVDTSRTILG